MESNVRWYSERDYPLGPPANNQYGIGKDGQPIQLPRDTRMWVSIEWAKEHGFEYPESTT